MPIYEYHCKDCQQPFEVFVRSISKPASAICPECGSEHVEKDVSSVSAVGGEGSLSSAASCAPSG